MKFKCIEVAGKLSRTARQWINRVEELREFIAGIGMQATERKNETVMPECAKAGKYEHEYIRHGTQSLIASFDIKTGRVVAECGNSQKASDLVGFIEKVAEKYINERTIHII
ncbi:MAG: transposase [Firmicutes bacterium]|nr:transposase [Bacillota bacterium]